MGRGRTVRTDRARERFLEVLAESCNVSEACRRANIGRATAYEWREDDSLFAKAWAEAEAIAVDRLEQVAWDRATGGVSDRMLEILLKAHRPEKYVERREVTGTGGGPVLHQIALVGPQHKIDVHLIEPE